MPEWLDGIENEELQGNESLVNIPDVETLAKNYLETKSKVGTGIYVPSEDANEEQVTAFHNKILEKAPNLMLKPNFEDESVAKEFYRSIGVPDDPAKYDAVELESGFKFDEVRDTTVRKLAAEAGLTPAQYKKVAAGILEFDHDISLKSEEMNMEKMKELKAEWGMAFDDKKALAEKVRDTFMDFIPDNLMDAVTIKALNNIGEQLVDGDGGLGDLNRGDDQDGKMTPADAKARIKEIMDNSEHAYWNSHDPGHKDALSHMVELQAAANPTASRDLTRAGYSG